jgi:hypothetical protein
MTVALLIAILEGCRQNAEVVYPNMEIDQKESISKVTQEDKGKYYPEEHRWLVVLR